MGKGNKKLPAKLGAKKKNKKRTLPNIVISDEFIEKRKEVKKTIETGRRLRESFNKINPNKIKFPKLRDPKLNAMMQNETIRDLLLGLTVRTIFKF